MYLYISHLATVATQRIKRPFALGASSIRSRRRTLPSRLWLVQICVKPLYIRVVQYHLISK